MKPDEKEVNEKIQERFKLLPKVVQNAITSADIEKHLRELANTHKLHLDQWESLENEVRLTLLGFQASEDLEENIREETGVSAEIARTLAGDISKSVFEPIRQELERQLEHPEAKEKEKSDVEEARSKLLESSLARNVASPAIPEPVSIPTIAATPPPPGPVEKAVRAPVSGAYKPGEASAVRKDVQDDPYREAPV